MLDDLHGVAANIGGGDGPTLVAKGTPPFLAIRPCLHFTANASVTPPTFQNVALQLVGEFALNGCQTAIEPVHMWHPKESTRHCCHLSFVKKCSTKPCTSNTAIVCHVHGPTSLNLLSSALCFDHERLALVSPLTVPNREAVVFTNAPLARRGSIRHRPAAMPHVAKATSASGSAPVSKTSGNAPCS